MSKLVMALRCIDGIVLAGDAPFRKPPEDEGVIRQLSQWTAILTHDDRAFGNRLINGFLASSPNLDASIGDIAAQAQSFFDGECRKLVASNQPVTLVGIIIAGIGEDATGDIEFYGLHIGNQFKPTPFEGNVFGGEYNTIARLLDTKLPTFGISVSSALPRAAFYYVESRSLPNIKLEPSLSLAMITYHDGFQSVDWEQVRNYIDQASRWSERMSAACAGMFSPTPGDGIGGQE
jgi:hypothetical protein